MQTHNFTASNSEHPLAASIGRASEVNPNFAMPLRGSGDGWIDAPTLFEGDDERLRGLVTAYGLERWQTTNNHAASSVFLGAYAARVTWPVISQYVLERRVPKVSLDNLAFHLQEKLIDATALAHPSFAVLPDDPAAGHPDAEVVADEAALYARLKEWLFDSNFSRVIEALNSRAGASKKISLNVVASACAQPFRELYLSAQDQDALVSKANAFFDDQSSMVYRQLTMEVFEHVGKRAFFSRRAGCCLWWRTQPEKKYCSNCILLSREQQDERFRELLARES